MRELGVVISVTAGPLLVGALGEKKGAALTSHETEEEREAEDTP